MSIFISIASYQDPLLSSTIKSACINAANEAGLVFGICDQSSLPIDVNTFSTEATFHYDHVEPILSKGPCWARHRLQSFYQNEDYFLQIDSHTQFEKNWDNILINQLNSIKELSDDAYFSKPIITSYPRGFEIINLENEEFKLDSTDDLVYSIAYRKDSLFMHDLFSRQVGLPLKTSAPVHGYLLAAGCLFTNGGFVKDIPYDPNYYFYGEEISMMLRAFTKGYSIFHTPSTPIFHLYNVDPEISERILHWNPDEDKNRITKWHELEKQSIQRLTDLIEGNLEEFWSLGKVNTLDDYAQLSGLDYKSKKVLDKRKAFESEFFLSRKLNKRPF
tara:strand:- start:962 stop:1957 length:996 start_codon:yes stop_codon:yes gene_type:complete